MKRLLSTLTLAALAACSPGEDEGSDAQAGGDHVWKAQTEALEKAKEAEQIIQNAAKAERKRIDEETD